MLLELTITNFRSFADEQRFSLVASERDAIAAEVDAANLHPLADGSAALKLAVVYGANASGKSNLFRAMRALRAVVLRSRPRGDLATEIALPLPAEPHLLRADTAQEPSELEVVCLVDGIQHRYGVAFDAQRISAEWLFRGAGDAEARVFERQAQQIDLGSDASPSAPLVRFVRPDTAFVAVAAEFNEAWAMAVVGWFAQLGLVEAQDISATIGWTLTHVANDPQVASGVRALVQGLDLGISDIRVLERERLDPGRPMQLRFDAAATTFATQGADGVSIWQVNTTHTTRDLDGAPAASVDFSMFVHESGGTQKLFALSGPLFDVLSKGRVLLLDEFDARLHPAISKALLELFRSPVTNPKGAQLVAFTHDTHLLDHEAIRRDQIWFTEKNQQGATQLYSLAEFKGARKDDRFGRRYLHGRYGAVPHLDGLVAALGRALQAPAEGEGASP